VLPNPTSALATTQLSTATYINTITIDSTGPIVLTLGTTTGTSTFSTSVPSAAYVIEPFYTVIWQSSDLSLFTPASLPVLQMQPGGYNPSGSSTASRAPGAGTQSSQVGGGSSKGRQIGIEVGAVLTFVCVVFVVSGLVLWNKLKTKQKKNDV
jgi:hypothetical protein